jgi:hypothetical protein
MLKHVCLSLGMVSLILLAGCGGDSTTTSSSDTTQPAVADAPPPATQPTTLPIPPDSIFAKIHVGEEMNEVYATIGPPNSVDSYQTGKGYNPFNFSGSDSYRQRAHYKGVGTITFSNDSRFSSGANVESVDYDPTERGY